MTAADRYADAASIAESTSATPADLAAAQVFATLALVDATRGLAEHRPSVELAQARAECARYIDIVAAARALRDRLAQIDHAAIGGEYSDLDGALYALDETVGADQP
jgi:hypothetical protein